MKLKTGEGTVRILHLGDSHIASDYISGPIRDRLQAHFGSAGRGFSHIDHRLKYGGRVQKRAESPWKKLRHVELHKKHLPFGFSAISLESKKKGASIVYAVKPEDQVVRLYYQQHEKGAAVALKVGKKVLSTVQTKGPTKSVVASVDLPPNAGKLRVVAQGRGAKLYGISFERKTPGLLYEPIGPVGGDAKLYLEFGRDSFTEHLRAHAPDLFVIMVGGNDALKVRKGWQSLADVRQHHIDLIRLLRTTVPGADCMLWSPMDSGKKKGGKVVSKRLTPEVQALQREVAEAEGCAYWDMFTLMGGAGSITRWSKARVMNADLIHPRRAAADLLGHEFADAFLTAVDP